MYVKRFIQEALANGNVVLAIGLDIANAFNSLPWRSISKALRWRKKFPAYLCRMIDAYLSSRWVQFPTVGGRLERREVLAGVPEGSVLVPTLWNLAFDAVVRSNKFPGCDIVCYADDTLVLVAAPDSYYACETANRQIRRLLRLVGELGLVISENKTEAVLFSKRGLRGNPKIGVGDAEVQVCNRMKYLGVILDSRLSFLPHFEYAKEKALRVVRSLGLLMPNLRGPSQARRRLFYNVVISVLAYGACILYPKQVLAPVWGKECIAFPSKQRVIRCVQRMAALRVICAYRTVSLDAAAVLAGVPPISLLVDMRVRTYHQIEDLKRENNLTISAVREVRSRENSRLRDKWKEYLLRPDLAGARTVTAVQPHLDSWLDRGHGSLSFRMTQILTEHGCFSSFLHRIRRCPTMACFHCLDHVDSAEHTLMHCPAWYEERGELRAALGCAISLPNVVGAIVDSRDAWRAFWRFAEKIMSMKEEAERQREALAVGLVPEDRSSGSMTVQKMSRDRGVDFSTHLIYLFITSSFGDWLCIFSLLRRVDWVCVILRSIRSPVLPRRISEGICSGDLV